MGTTNFNYELTFHTLRGIQGTIYMAKINDLIKSRYGTNSDGYFLDT